MDNAHYIPLANIYNMSYLRINLKKIYNMSKIQISEEYIETVCTWLMEWVDDPASMVIPQFLAKYGISWKYLKQMMHLAPCLNNTFEVVVSKLHARWIDLAFKKDELSRHLTSILMRYLRVYDAHAFDVEMTAKKEMQEANSGAQLILYDAEDFKNIKLSGHFKDLYEKNVDRRRSRDQAE
jgi:hypothetical protein